MAQISTCTIKECQISVFFFLYDFFTNAISIFDSEILIMKIPKLIYRKCKNLPSYTLNVSKSSLMTTIFTLFFSWSMIIVKTGCMLCYSKHTSTQPGKGQHRLDRFFGKISEEPEKWWHGTRQHVKAIYQIHKHSLKKKLINLLQNCHYVPPAKSWYWMVNRK